MRPALRPGTGLECGLLREQQTRKRHLIKASPSTAIDLAMQRLL